MSHDAPGSGLAPASILLHTPICSNGAALLGIGLLQWRLGAMLDAPWEGLLVGGVRVYAGEAYREAFGVCFVIAALAFVASCAVTETRCRNVN